MSPPPGPQHLPLQRCHCQGHPQPQACPEGKGSSMTLLSILPHLCGAPCHSHGARIPSIAHRGGGTELCPLQAVTAALFPSPQPHTLTWRGGGISAPSGALLPKEGVTPNLHVESTISCPACTNQSYASHLSPTDIFWGNFSSPQMSPQHKGDFDTSSTVGSTGKGPPQTVR